MLEQSLDLDGAIWVRYDPAIPELSTIPIERADFIVNTDVLEHIPEQDIGDVLEHISAPPERRVQEVRLALRRSCCQQCVCEKCGFAHGQVVGYRCKNGISGLRHPVGDTCRGGQAQPRGIA